MSDDGQKEVMKLIYDCVKSGHYEFDTELFCSHLDEAGAKNMPVILGCTELPIAFRHFGIDKYETVDPSCILARSIIIRAGAKLK
jgi:aspartate/glutamate racemase